MRIYTLRTLLASATLFASLNTNGQCTNQVIHTSGSQVVNGIDVTVTKLNFADTLTTYCSSITTPYIIGYKWGIGSGSGQYNFQFQPPASSVTLNLSGINKNVNDYEEVTISIDGSHYAIPAAGQPNGCDSMAVLTPTGNIAGHPSGQTSGWKALTIPGPIHYLAVADYSVGSAGGAVFSLFVCNADLGVNNAQQARVQLYPNPFRQHINITTARQEEARFTLYDVLSKKMIETSFTGNTAVDASSLASGLYYYELHFADGQTQTGKLVKE